MEKASEKEKILVFKLITSSTCSECAEELGKGRLLRVEKTRPLCLECADLSHLLFLPSGNVALTRRAKRYSDLSAVVVKFSRARKRYERQGLLVTEAGLARAEAESLADAEVRARSRERSAARREKLDDTYCSSFAEQIRKQFPRCPGNEAVAIAEHTCEKYSGRIGRTAAAKELSPAAIDLAVRAHVRHVHTPYEKLLGSGLDRHDARRTVAPVVEEVLLDWSGKTSSGE